MNSELYLQPEPPGPRATRAEVFAGLGFAAAAHFFVLALMIFGPSTPGMDGGALLSGPKRLPMELALEMHKRKLEGPIPRRGPGRETAMPRRAMLMGLSRRGPLDAIFSPYRGAAQARGRRVAALNTRAKRWSIDWGTPDDSNVLQAMIIPQLGLKAPEPDKLPRITKYEQPEKQEEAVNISQDNQLPKELPKNNKHKEAELDKKRKKVSLNELLDAPENEDPRARPTMLSEMIGVDTGSTEGVGTEKQEGLEYLGKLELNLRKAFKIPVFLTDEEIKKLRVEIKIEELDTNGRILRYRVVRRSGSPAFDGAAIDAIRRFVPNEGGQDSFEVPPPELLQMINTRGVLLKLEGKKLGR